jgi:hypothetical protein
MSQPLISLILLGARLLGAAAMCLNRCSVGLLNIAMRHEIGPDWEQERNRIYRQSLARLNWKYAAKE